jgi:hypothetical protein
MRLMFKVTRKGLSKKTGHMLLKNHLQVRALIAQSRQAH